MKRSQGMKGLSQMFVGLTLQYLYWQVRARLRFADERGQTAAEYIGIIIVIAGIIGAIAVSGIGSTITSGISEVIERVIDATPKGEAGGGGGGGGQPPQRQP
jgi:hypothetical protein